MIRALASILSLAAAVSGQPATKAPVFEAAAIKPSESTYSNSGWHSSTGQITIENMTLRQLVGLAYSVKPYQITGGPKWQDGDRWVIVARLEDGVKNDRGDGPMRLALRSLLADRYQLVVHQETKDMAAYALTVAKNGPKMETGDASKGSHSNWARGKGTYVGVSMSGFANMLSSHLDRPVVDKTGLAGVFNFNLEWAPEQDTDATGPSLFTALQEQIGLKLDAHRMAVEIIVIDKAEKPGEN
jgi:uncharacterized protein (TIGR03435 family)